MNSELLDDGRGIHHGNRRSFIEQLDGKGASFACFGPRHGNVPVIEFTVYGKAQPAGSKRAFVVGGRAIVTDANKNAKPWQAEVKAAALEVFPAAQFGGGPLLDGPLELVVTFYEPRPKGHFNSKGELNAQGLRNPRPAKKPDATKLVRGLEDAMTGVIYGDDAQITDQHVFKRYGEPARTEVRITSIPFPGEESDESRAGGTARA